MLESNLNDLYQSTVEAFPKTGLRQHATDPIKIVEMNWIPFKGIKTLLVSGVALNEGRQYKCHLLFKNVNYNESEVHIVASDYQRYGFKKLKYNETDVLVRCNCMDFYHRFNYYNHIDKTLWGSKRGPYESKGTGIEANPTKSPGMCKHLIKFSEALVDAKVLLA